MMVKLEDAIKHAEEKSGSCECGKEHAQLAKWLKELTALRATPASAPVTAPDYRIADRGFRWDAETRQHIPQLLIEFAPVPANEPNDSRGWKDRDSLAAMLAAAPTPPVSEDRKDAENSALKLAKTKLSWITKRANYLDVLDIAREANEALAAIDALGDRT